MQPPGRPIVSGNGCLTETISQLIDYLRPHVEGLTSYLQDTSDLLWALEGIHIPKGAWLVALDVEALYISIPHDKGVAVVESLISEGDPIISTYNKLILDLLEFVLTNKVFLFGRSHYLQVRGVAMRTRCAPSYTNLYLGGWERDLFCSEEMQSSLCKIYLWHQYIKNIFFIWTGTKDELLLLFEKLKVNQYNLKFTLECQQ